MTTARSTAALDGALTNARGGWRQFPVNDQKVPYEEGWQQFATTDEATIRAWAAKYPGCNFGTTANADQIIIDLDTKKGKNGIEDLARLEHRFGKMPVTKTVRTPTGGLHLYFHTSRQIRNTVGKIAPGIDIRGFLCYVVSPGSSVPDGVYTEIRSVAPAPITDWFLNLGDQAAKERLERPDDSEVAGSIPEGKRDNELCRWAGMLRGQGLTANEMEAALHVINQDRCTVPVPDADVIRIADSIGKKPRGVAQVISDFATDTIPKTSLTSYNAKAIKARTIPAPDQLLENFCDTGDVVGIFGKSKAKKSWFMANLGIALATGVPFLAWSIPKKRRVVMFQLEVKRDHYERRIQMMANELVEGLENLEVVHCRGMALTAAEIGAEAKARGAEVVLIDPIYPLFPNGENNAEDVRPIVQEFGRLAEAGITVVYAMHDAKGRSGDRELVDRGSGSGIIGRAYDAAFFLDPHADDDFAVVVRSICRNYPAYDDMVAQFVKDTGTFEVDPELAPDPKTSQSESRKRSRGEPLAETAERVYAAIPEVGAVHAELRAITEIGVHKLRDCLHLLESAGRVKLVTEGKNHAVRAIKTVALPCKTEIACKASNATVEDLM